MDAGILQAVFVTLVFGFFIGLFAGLWLKSGETPLERWQRQKLAEARREVWALEVRLAQLRSK